MTESFEASVAISKGVKPIANSGWLAIAGGRVQLFDSGGQRLGDEPVGNVWAKGRLGTMGSGVSLWMGAEKYMVSPGSGNRPTGIIVPTGAGIGAASVAHGRAFAKQLYAALEAAGGNLGKP